MKDISSREQDLRYSEIRSAMLEKRFKDAESMAIVIIRTDPLNAQGWVFLGESLMLQGYKETAINVFDRAWLLDPQATWVPSIFSVLLKLKADTPRLDIEMLMELPCVTVSAAMIVKNEERCIARCLDSLAEAVDEIIIVDTGSTDATLTIIQQYPKVKLYTYAWDDNFSNARNESLRYVTSEWAICVDGDEYLMEQDIHCIRQAAALYSLSARPAILSIGRLNAIEGNVHLNYNESRMFPMNQGIHYQGRVHEQVVGIDDKYEGEFLRTPVRIRLHHDGYEPAIYQSRGKSEQRLRQLQWMIEEQPDQPGWWLLYGREILQQGDHSKALELLGEAERLADITPSFGRRVEILILLVHIYLEDGLLDSAEASCLKALAIHPDYPDAHYLLAQIEKQRSFMLIEEAKSHLGQAKLNAHNYRGHVAADAEIALWKASETLAEAAVLAGNPQEAKVLLDGVEQIKLRGRSQR